MLTKIEIENFKSIYKESIELGRVNVFIGENGCGKTNILEAVGMASAALENKLRYDELALKGLRVAKPSITYSSFSSLKANETVKIFIEITDEKTGLEFPLRYYLSSSESDDIYSDWYSSINWGGSSSKEENLAEVKPISEKELQDDFNKKGDLSAKRAKIVNTKGFPLKHFLIYQLSTEILRGIGGRSLDIPGIHGENLDVLIANFTKEEFQELLEHSRFISWLEDIVIDKAGTLRLEGHNLNLSQSKLYFRDKYMAKKNNIFSAENANEGILHILFYLALFISKRTPKFFAIDNIETALNPQLCRDLMSVLVKLAEKNDKQVLITTHNPAILDGLDLHNDQQRLFTVSRNIKGHTKVERLKLKPDAEVGGNRLKLSELWMRNYIGALPQHH